MTKLLTISGSGRKGSLNQLTLDCLSKIATDAGAKVESLSLVDLQIPLYHADLEGTAGLPDGVKRLREALSLNNGFIVGCPEYNGFITPLLLNAIDWATRSEEKRPDVSPFANKVVLISSASPGAFGGMRAAAHLRTLLSGIGCIVAPMGMVVPSALQAFNEAGAFTNDAMQARAKMTIDRMLDIVRRFA